MWATVVRCLQLKYFVARKAKSCYVISDGILFFFANKIDE